jgi:hypothetical protein
MAAGKQNEKKLGKKIKKFEKYLKILQKFEK